MTKKYLIAALASSALTVAFGGGVSAREPGPVYSNYGQCISDLAHARHDGSASSAAYCRPVEGGYTYADQTIDPPPPVDGGGGDGGGDGSGELPPEEEVPTEDA